MAEVPVNSIKHTVSPKPTDFKPWGSHQQTNSTNCQAPLSRRQQALVLGIGLRLQNFWDWGLVSRSRKLTYFAFFYIGSPPVGTYQIESQFENAEFSDPFKRPGTSMQTNSNFYSFGLGRNHFERQYMPHKVV